MLADSESHLHLEIGHVLFIDIVGYSKLLIDEQRERIQETNSVALRGNPRFCDCGSSPVGSEDLNL
jgi:hypothetical protein